METYNANCHCGAVRFSFSLAPLKTIKINRCNCSICTKNSYLLVYPLRKDVVFHRGEDQLAEYRFGNRTKPHKFCPNCGTSVLIDFKESQFEKERGRMAINVGCFRSPICLAW
ncbi:Mss4-like protein [Aspergillus novoparasiticus]|uniref:Mss4-like protein n=1 Tax=Aspergillus novoparasiticus TaxID=986946 RepID=A0A5N6EJS2_9EURO|nr:Mss4-like protein [Aspergillus novoparasiticus]